MREHWDAVAVAFVGLLGLGGVVYKDRNNPKAQAADAAQSITDAAVELIEPLRHELAALRVEFDAARASYRLERESLRAELATLRSDLAAERAYVSILVATIRSRGIEVPPRPLESGQHPSSSAE